MNNSIKSTKIIILFFCSLFFFNCNAQLSPNSASCSTAEDETLIVGTWVSEGLTLDNKWVFNSNKVLIRYDEGIIYDTYNWDITCSITPSGLKDYYLTIMNISDASDKYVYNINTLTQERLVLVYQRGDGQGIGKLATYLRQ